MPLFHSKIDTVSHPSSLDTSMNLHIRRRLGAIGIASLENMHSSQDSRSQEKEPETHTHTTGQQTGTKPGRTIIPNRARAKAQENQPTRLSSKKQAEKKKRRKKKDSPLKRAENRGRLRRPAQPPLTARHGAHEDGHGDEAREPEQHGDGVEGQHGELVGEAGEVAGHEGEVGGHEEGPDGGEDEEVDGGGGGEDGEVVVVVCDWGGVLVKGGFLGVGGVTYRRRRGR